MSEAADQSLQFLRPTHQNFSFISVSGRFDRIFCPFFMARIQCSALTESFRVRQPSNAPFVLSCPPAGPRLPCGCRRRCKGFPSASSWPSPFGGRSALSVSRTSLPSQSPSLWQAPFGQGLSPFSSHRTDGLFLRKMSLSRSPCSSPCFQFPRSQCRLRPFSLRLQTVSCASLGSESDGSLH